MGDGGVLKRVGALDLFAAEFGDLVGAAESLHLLVHVEEVDLVAHLLPADELPLPREEVDVTLEPLEGRAARDILARLPRRHLAE